jgi:hypothetical protein
MPPPPAACRTRRQIRHTDGGVAYVACSPDEAGATEASLTYYNGEPLVVHRAGTAAAGRLPPSLLARAAACPASCTCLPAATATAAATQLRVAAAIYAAHLPPAENGLADRVLPPQITMRDFDEALLHARPTVSLRDLGMFESYTAEFGKEGI